MELIINEKLKFHLIVAKHKSGTMSGQPLPKFWCSNCVRYIA